MWCQYFLENKKSTGLFLPSLRRLRLKLGTVAFKSCHPGLKLDKIKQRYSFEYLCFIWSG